MGSNGRIAIIGNGHLTVESGGVTMTSQLALHETMEINELLSFKNVCMTKATTMQVLVTDAALKNLMQTCATLDRQHIYDLQGLLKRGTQTVGDSVAMMGTAPLGAPSTAH